MKLSRQKPISNLTISFYFGFTTFKASKALSFKERRLRITSCWCFSRIFLGSRPSCHTTTLQTKHSQVPDTLKSQTHSNPRHSQVQDTWVANSHACFKETSLKTLKPISQQRPQAYKIYRAPSLHFIKVQDKSTSWHHPSYTPTPNDALETVY